MNPQAKLSDCRTLPSDYAKPYGGTIERWADDAKDYPDCSGGCQYFAPLFNAESQNCQDGDFGVCLNPDGPRHGLLTFEHQAGFGCFVAARDSDVVGLDYFKLAHAHGQPVCFGCGKPDPGTLSRPPWAAIHDHLKKFGYWTPEDIAAEANRYRMLIESGISVVLCDDCWQFGYGWSPREAELLHSRARRFANETVNDYRRRQVQRARWDRAAGEVRRKALLPAAFRWDDIWLLNNPGSELPYEAAP